MTTITNAKNLHQFSSRFYFIVEQILAFASNPNMVEEVENLTRNFKQIALVYK